MSLPLSHFCSCKQPLINIPITPLKLLVHQVGLCWYLSVLWSVMDFYLGCIAFPWEKYYHPTYIYLTWHLLISCLISCSRPSPSFLRVSLCSLGCSRTTSVDHTDLKLRRDPSTCLCFLIAESTYF